MNLSSRSVFSIGAIGLSLVLAACSSFAHSYMSPEERQAHGRRLLQEAVQQSDVVSIRGVHGGVAVISVTEAGQEEYCGILLSSWTSERHREGWSNRNGTQIRCTGYHGIVDVRPMDMRNCQGSECLWLRGL